MSARGDENQAPTRRELSRWLVRQARPTLTPLLLSEVMRILGFATQAALFGLAGWAIGTAAVGGSVNLGAVLWTAAGIVALKALARYLEQYCGHLVAFKALSGLRTLFFRRLAPQAPGVFLVRRTGDLLSRVTKDVDSIEVFFAHTLVPLVAAVVVPLGACVWLAVAVHPLLALVALVGWGLLVAVIPWVGARSARASAGRLRDLRGRLAQEFTDTVQGIREVLAFDAEGWRRAAVDGVDERIGAELVSMSRDRAVRRWANATVQLAIPSVVLLVGAGLVARGAVSAAEVCAAVGVILATTPAALAIEELGGVLDEAFSSAERVREIVEGTPVAPAPTHPVAAPEGPVGVVFDSLRFRYPGDAAHAATRGGEASGWALDGIDLAVPSGTCVGIVGASGAGKSTLASLLARVADPDEGSVTVGGVDVRDLSDDDLRRLVGFVPQQPWIFSGTVADNLRLAAPEASVEDLLAACAQARLDDLVADAKGLARDVGERGEKLSGGQRQRLAIAQALLRRTPVLVFDEITSQLDEKTEASLMTTVRELARGRTTLVIAHRLSTVGWADRIVVLDGGRVVEEGAPEELASHDGPYHRLLVLQGEAIASAEGDGE